MPVPTRCLGQCGALIISGGHCPRCKKGTGWGPGHHRGTQARFRAAVLANAGYRCQHLQSATRCERAMPKWPLFAHHTEPGNDDPTTGQALCREHHREVDRHAR